MPSESPIFFSKVVSSLNKFRDKFTPLNINTFASDQPLAFYFNFYPMLSSLQYYVISSRLILELQHKMSLRNQTRD